MIRKEAVLLAALIAALLNLAIHLFDIKWVDTDLVEGISSSVAGVLVALWARSKVFSEQTVREAGFTPAELKSRADSPSVQPKLVGE